MIIDKLEPTHYMPIWQPKWHTDRGPGKVDVWPLKRKVDQGKCKLIEIEFTKTKSDTFKGRWCIEKKKAQKFPVGNNGKDLVYMIPFEEFSKLERSENSRFEI